MAKYLLLLCIINFSVLASADLETSPKGTIKRLISYSKFGNGDTYVELNINGYNM